MPLPNKQPWREWDFFVRASAGHVQEVVPAHKNSSNTAVGVTVEDIWNTGGVLQYLTSSETMDVVSSSTDDDGNPAGIGAQTLILYGVNNNYVPIEEVITMDGTSAVTTTNSFLRVNRMNVLDVGSNDSNVGTITATASSAATVQAEISAAEGGTSKSQMTVPDGYFAIVTSLTLSTSNLTTSRADLQLRLNGNSWIDRYRIDFIGVSIEQRFLSPIVLEPQTDLRIQTNRLSAGADVSVSSYMEFLLVDENFINSNLPVLGF